jgi:IclR family transcriptional regulator, acetate operon repressor
MAPERPVLTSDQPLDRALLVIEEVLNAQRPVTLSDIAGSAGLAPATVHRIVTQLEARSLLKRVIGSKRILPGPRLVALGAHILESAFVSDRSHAALTALAQATDEHCHIGIVYEQEVLYVDSARRAASSRLHFEPGTRAPVYCTSIGKVFMASLPKPALDGFTASIPFKAFTPNTITSRAKLVREIGQVRERGWASTDEEFTPGVVGCAVPIKGQSGEFVAGLGISVPKARCTPIQLQAFVPALRSCGSEVEKVLLTEVRRQG